MATGIMGDASHVLRISRRWRSCSSTVKIPSTARSADSDLSGQKCSTSAVGSDASAGLSQERIWSPRKLQKKPSPVVQRAGLPDGERPINAWRTASCRAAISPITWNTCDVEHPSQGKSESSIRARAPPCGGHSAACRGRRPVAATSAAALRRMRRRRGAAPMAGGAQEPSSLRNDRLPSMPMRNMRPLPLARARACDSSDRVCVCPVPCLSSRSCFERSI